MTSYIDIEKTRMSSSSINLLTRVKKKRIKIQTTEGKARLLLSIEGTALKNNTYSINITAMCVVINVRTLSSGMP